MAASTGNFAVGRPGAAERRCDGPWLLAIDTGTSRIVVAAGRADGALIAGLDWPAEHRHGERLLAGINALIAETACSRARIRAVIVGTGPGAFTGLRVGLATAKTLAHALDLPLVGVSTGDALLEAAASSGIGGGSARANLVLSVPAGPRDRTLVRVGEPPLLVPGGGEPVRAPGEVEVAVDLDGRATDEAVELGRVALAGLGGALLRLGAARLAAGSTDDPAGLVPEYVTLPRGAGTGAGAITLSSDPR